MKGKNQRLEQFGLNGLASPEERLKGYRELIKSLPRSKQALAWLDLLDHDPLVRGLLEIRVAYPRHRKREVGP